MMTKHLTFVVLILSLFSCGQSIDKSDKVKKGEIEIHWLDSLTGDFSFTNNWNYPEGVYRNEFGQLSCDGLCPPEIDRMRDNNGRIYKDSLEAFYKLVDTSHQYHSIKSESWTYEWDGTNFVTASRKNEDTTICFTHNTISTHSRLILTIVKDKCVPTIELNSISPTGTKIYNCKGGYIEIDKTLWEKGIIKANFDFVFDHKENPKKPMYWRGKIYTSIDKRFISTRA